MRALREAGLSSAVARTPDVQVWVEERNEYVEAHPDGAPLEDEDWLHSGLSPNDITYVVDVVPADAFAQRETRRALRKLRRPILRGGVRQFVVGARDSKDAHGIAATAETFNSVRSATPRRLSWWSRWLLRQRLLGTYASNPGDYAYYQGDAGGVGGDGGGGGGNGGS